jgi:hypothetical protein
MIADFQERHVEELDTLYRGVIESARQDLTGGTAQERAAARGQALQILTAAERLNAPTLGAEIPGGGFFLEEILYAKHTRPSGKGTDQP